jgi:hypothetical protein
MQSYFLNKVASILLPALVFGYFLLTVPVQARFWQLLLMVLIAFGYTHFIAGYYYQVRALMYSVKPNRELRVFAVLAAASLLVVGAFYTTDTMHYMPFLVIPYFMLHGFFNEQSLFFRQSGGTMPVGIAASIALWLTAVALLSFLHPSAYYTATLEFPSITEAMYLVQSMPPYLFFGVQIVGWCGIVISFLILLYMFLVHAYYRVTVPLLLLGAFFTYLLFVGGPFNNVYMQYILLTYHFATWMFFYGARFFSERKQFAEYSLLHVGIISICLLSLTPLVGKSEVSSFIFNANVFLSFSTVHITTSFMNELWFKQFLQRVWST